MFAVALAMLMESHANELGHNRSRDDRDRRYTIPLMGDRIVALLSSSSERSTAASD